ncbi:protein WEAK CHLOROPLAST MOVEMENT UNDER BLUE LIGHT 1-like [Hibiscus syriacus]|uniref:protein WEAK CHLOROPLAST MOVEMENT UNDER BLUE LIGHT 1-like n=1 Tax=Hibiscus syriacus TaxID=106335 RepID=UPI001921B3AF|nr:protein WEAK CHLOROPLAST MOVEMENT UNDER BLUE LIGHT 1-like [Hibiscus syriacus]
MGAEEKRNGAAMARDQDARLWEKELKQAEKDTQKLNQQIQSKKDLKPKLDTASVLLRDLKVDLTVYRESKFNLENNGHSTDESQTPEKRTRTEIPAAVTLAKKELEEVKLKILNATAEVDSLKVLAASLKSELEKEESAIATIKQTEGMSVDVASLKDDPDNTESKIASVQMNEKKARDKMVEVPKQLQQATQEALDATTLAQMAHAVVISLEEYNDLRKRAYEAEEQANMRVSAFASQVEAAKQSQSSSLEKLEQVKREMAERKEQLKIASVKAEKAAEEKLGVEQELRRWRSEHEQQRKTSKSCRSVEPRWASFDGTNQRKNLDQIFLLAAL